MKVRAAPLAALCVAALIFTLLPSVGSAASPYWMNFYGFVYRDGQPLSGATISVTWGGDDQSRSNGEYGLLAVFGDDPTTPEKDGATPGEPITFFVDGVPVHTEYWVAHGFVVRVDLRTGHADAGETQAGCEDDYEQSDNAAEARELTGPERHTFWSRAGGPDFDWAKFWSRQGWVYQVRAWVGQFSVTDPQLRLFSASGSLLAENNDYFERSAEIWYWNGGVDDWLFIEASEANDFRDCGAEYTLEVIPWSPGDFHARFGQ